MKTPGWLKWENDVQDLLDLAPVPGSGNQWYAPSDGVTKGHHSEVIWPLMVDCKQTIQKSFSLTRKMLDQWVLTAKQEGKRFALPIRFSDQEDTGRTSDYIVVPLDDYVELVVNIREGVPVDPPPRLTRSESNLMQQVADRISDPTAQRTFLGIVAKMEH